MPPIDKPKTTIKELNDLYDIEDTENIPEKDKTTSSDVNATFEEYTEYYDEKQKEEE